MTFVGMIEFCEDWVLYIRISWARKYRHFGSSTSQTLLVIFYNFFKFSELCTNIDRNITIIRWYRANFWNIDSLFWFKSCVFILIFVCCMNAMLCTIIFTFSCILCLFTVLSRSWAFVGYWMTLCCVLQLAKYLTHYWIYHAHNY